MKRIKSTIGLMLVLALAACKNADPVYLSYEDLRGPLQIDTSKELEEAGKIYRYQNYLFVNEPNQGIHVYDNTHPDAPVHKGFIVIPGNLDIAIKNGYLYADSYVDLIVIDLSNPDNLVVTKRIEDVFPYDAYQNIPDEICFDPNDIDETKGVIVGYENYDGDDCSSGIM